MGSPEERDDRGRDISERAQTEVDDPSAHLSTTDPGAASAADFSLDPGTTLGEYQIQAKIGEGSMGVVYSAIHPTIAKRAAIKVLKRKLCEDLRLIERFVDEARVVNEIGHPNIVDIFSFGEMPDGRRYFAMELFQGETLRDRINRGRMSLTGMAAVMRPLVRALAAAHDKGIIHRDVKPENVFLVEIRDEAPLVKLLDFGVAKLVNDKHRLESTGEGKFVGTPAYGAPEQARTGHAIGPPADVYALGAIAFELATGRPPFVAEHPIAMITAHVTETPPAPSSLVAEIPEEIDQLLLAMLAKAPEDRPTLAHVRSVLDRIEEPRDQDHMRRAITIRPHTPLHGVPIIPIKTELGAADTIASPAQPASRVRWLLVALAVAIAATAAFLLSR